MGNWKDVQTTCRNNNPVKVKDGTSNLGVTAGPSSGRQPVPPGVLMAWNWEGHGHLTAAAIDELRKQLPSDVQAILRWVGTQRQTQNRDITDVPTLGHWTPEGQRHHFMKYSGQTDQDAYDVAVAWIFSEATLAAELLRSRLGPRRRYQESGDWGLGEQQESVGPHLGNALHSLQDSFAPGHVKRDSDLVIRGINIYDKENKHPTEPGKPGHAEYDASWKDKEGHLTALGQAAADASVVLILFFLHTAYGHTAQANAQKEILLEKYLRLNPSSEAAPGGGVEKQQGAAAGRWIG